MKKLFLTVCLVLSLLLALTSSPVKAEILSIPDLSTVTLTLEDISDEHDDKWKKCGSHKLDEVQQHWIEAGWIEAGAKPTNFFCFGYSPGDPILSGMQVISGFTQIVSSPEEQAAFDKKLKLILEKDGNEEINPYQWSDFAWYKEDIDHKKEFFSKETIKAFRRGGVGVLISQAKKDEGSAYRQPQAFFDVDKASNKLDKLIVNIYTQIETAKIFEDDELETQPSQPSASVAPITHESFFEFLSHPKEVLTKTQEIVSGDSPTTETNSNFEPSNSGSKSEIYVNSVEETSSSSKSGNCDYPWQTDSAGRRCGKRAASVRAGGRLGGTN